MIRLKRNEDNVIYQNETDIKSILISKNEMNHKINEMKEKNQYHGK